MAVRRFIDTTAVALVLILIVTGQVMAKIGSGVPGRHFFGLNFFLAASYGIFLIRGALWAWVLRRHPVSRVYPFLSLAYPLVLLSGILLFDEVLSPGKIAGTLLIIGGSILIVPGVAE